MHLPTYKIIERSDDLSEFRFISEGPNGMIHKVILFDLLEDDNMPVRSNLYNIALLDVLPDGSLSDNSLSNNNDMAKILATTVQILIGYTSVFPERTVFIQGSDDAGQRISLYHRAIKNNLFIFEKDFHIEGVIDNERTEKFQPDRKYLAFLVKRK